MPSQKQPKDPATTQSVVAGLGPANPSFRAALEGLRGLYRRMEDSPALQLRTTQWRRYLALVYGEETGDPELFLKHTYLALVARLLAAVSLGVAATLSDRELSEIVTGEYFQDRHGLVNFVEEDFFTWPLLEPSHQDGLALLRSLLNTLETSDFSQVKEDVLKELYPDLVDPSDRHDLGGYCTPGWLAEMVLRDELHLPEDPHRSLLDPSCGSGTFLFTAIRLMREALAKEDMAPADILQHILDNVVGMDAHPLAVTIARTNYLLALGDLLRSDRGEITVPVYLADSIKLPETTAASTFAIEAEPTIFLHVPHALAMNPEGFDYLLPRMKNKYGSRSYLRDSRQEAHDRVMLSFHNFLLARGNWRKPFYLSPEDAEVMEQTQLVLLDLMAKDKGTLWFFILRNALRPVYLREQQFDIVVGNPPWLALDAIRDAEQQRWAMKMLEQYGLSKSATSDKATMADLFFARAADLYLNHGGRIAFVMPRSAISQKQQAVQNTQLSLQKVIDPKDASVLSNIPACVGVAQKSG